MWFQVELAQPAMLTEIEFDSPGASAGRGGGGGRGAAGATGARAPRRRRAIPARLSGRGLARWREVGEAGCRRQGQQLAYRDHVRAGSRPVRADHADRGRGEWPTWAITNLHLYEVGPGK